MASSCQKIRAVPVRTQRLDPSFFDAQLRIGNYLVDIDLVYGTQSVAAWTGPLGGVERKSMRGRFIIGYTGGRAHQLAAEITRILSSLHPVP